MTPTLVTPGVDRSLPMPVQPGTATPPAQRRKAFRLPTYLRVGIQQPDPLQDPITAFATNFSGTGAQIVTRQRPTSKRLLLDLDLPGDFVEELAGRRIQRQLQRQHRAFINDRLFVQACQHIKARFAAIEAHLVHCRPRNGQGLYTLGVAFEPPGEEGFRLVRHLERNRLRQRQEERRQALAEAA